MIDSSWTQNEKFWKFAQLMGITSQKDSLGISFTEDWRTAKRLEEVYAYGKIKSGSDDPVQAAWAIKDVTRRLGITHRGEQLVDKLWQYVRLSSDRENIEKELSLLTGEDIERQQSYKDAEIEEKFRAGDMEAGAVKLKTMEAQGAKKVELKEKETQVSQQAPGIQINSVEKAISDAREAVYIAGGQL